MRRRFSYSFLNLLAAYALLLSVAPTARGASPPAQNRGPSVTLMEGDTSAEPLELGRPVERELNGGETHFYSITLAEGQFLRVTVEQRGVDVVVALIGPDNLLVVGVDNAKETQGTESLSAVALASGVYRLGVQSQHKNAAAGRYEVKIEELREAAATEINTLGADAALRQGDTLRHMETAESLRKSIEKYGTAASLYHAAGNRKSEASALNRMGMIYNSLGEKQQALTYLEQSLAIRRGIPDPGGEAATLNNMAAVYNSQGDKRRALAIFEKALQIMRGLDEPDAVATLLNNIGAVRSDLGDKKTALEYYGQALTIYRNRDDRAGQATTLNNIGKAYDDLGDKKTALADYEQSLDIATAIGDRSIEAAALNNIGKVYDDQGDKKTALVKFEQALKLRAAINDLAGAGVTLSNIGAVHSDLGDKPKALEFFAKALQFHRAVGDKAGEAATLNNIGAVYSDLGDKRKAIEYYEQALPLARAVYDTRGEARTLNNLGSVYDQLGDKQKAISYFEQALPPLRDIGDRSGRATTLNNLALVYSSLGERQKAFDRVEEALKLYRDLEDRAGEATALNTRGGVYKDRGDEQQALADFTQASALYHEVENPRGEAASFNNIGAIYSELGDWPKALDNYTQALDRSHAVSDPSAQATALNNLGTVHVKQRDYTQALAYYEQALPLHRAVGDRNAQAETLNNIGVVYSEIGERQRALERLEEALDLRRQVGDRAGEGVTLNNIGMLFYEKGERQKALEYYEQALPLMHDTEYRSGEAGTLGNVGVIYEAAGDKARALDYYLQAVSKSERFRETTTVEEVKVGLAQRAAPAYERAALLLVALGQRKKAFDLTESARARAFLDQLGNARIDVHKNADPRLVEQEQTLDAKLRSLDARIGDELAKPAGERSEEMIKSLNDERADDERLYEGLSTRFKLSDPEYASLRSVAPLQLREVQKLLDKDTTLLSYFVAEERTLAFVVTRDSFDVVELPVGRETLVATVGAFRRFDNIHEARSEELEKLYGWLIAPLKQYVKTPTVGIIPHGVLHYLSFAALTDGRSYLGEQHRLFYLPSASVLKFIREKEKPGGRQVLAVAQAAAKGFPQLRYVDAEVDAIARLYGAKPFHTDSLSKDEFKRRVAEADIVHVAVHAEYNSANPLFTRIMIGPYGGGDGGLTVGEVYQLDLSKASLVVLSACKTQLGPYSTGDDIVGLNRAFIYAGTPAVVASLWPVDDPATTEFMEAFYTNLRRGLSRPAALQAAQAEVRKTHPHPYYWAGFVLTGGVGGK
jgi:tetratricopeptide (TPR) repeat protein/CHAT domain-containing protein